MPGQLARTEAAGSICAAVAPGVHTELIMFVPRFGAIMRGAGWRESGTNGASWVEGRVSIGEVNEGLVELQLEGALREPHARSLVSNLTNLTNLPNMTAASKPAAVRQRGRQRAGWRR